jgi:DNA-binding NtrC family response regulator
VARTIHASAPVEDVAPLAPLAGAVLDAELLRTTMEAYIKRCAELETDQVPTLLLLDVDQLAADAQHELMGYLAIEELGLRTLATARLPLVERARQGEYYPPLAHRLSTITVSLPPLADRPQDIPLLAQYLVEQLNAREGRYVDGFTPQAIEQLLAFPWTWNVDELKQTVADCYHKACGSVIERLDLPARIRLGLDAALHPVAQPVAEDLAAFLEDAERSMIARALQRSGGNKTQAAKMLSISRGRLLRRIEQLRVPSSPSNGMASGDERQ